MTQEVIKASEITTAVAFMFMERAQKLRMDNETRDKLCLEYFLGATTALHLRGEIDAAARLKKDCEVISDIGYQFVVEIASRALAE